MSKNLLTESIYVSIGGQLIVTRVYTYLYIISYCDTLDDSICILLLELSYPKGETQDDLYSTQLRASTG